MITLANAEAVLCLSAIAALGSGMTSRADEPRDVGRSVVLQVKPEGSIVKRGDLIGKIADPALTAKLADREAEAKRAEAALANARLTLEVARVAVTEYLEVTYKEELAAIRGEIARAESDMEQAGDRLEWSLKKQEHGVFVRPSQIDADRLAITKARFIYEQSKTKLMVLEKYTWDKIVKELRAKEAGAEADEAGRRADLERSKARRDKVRRKVDRLEIVAPADGRLILRDLADPGAR